MNNKPQPRPPATITWKCANCPAINYAHHRFCGECGEPNPKAREAA
jgi:NADH pyrophosphatase NudC (nudix superfamily)